MSTPRLSLAKVMTQANKNDSNPGKQRPDQVRRGPGHRPADFGKPARATAEGRAHGAGHPGVRAVRHAVRRPLGAGTPFGHDARRAGRAREGATALDDPRDRGLGGARPGDAGAALDRPAPGGAERDRGGPGGGATGPAAPGRLAGQTAEGADPAGAGDPARGRADSGEAQPGLTPAASAKPARGRMFISLRNRNYRLFAAGQVVSNSGTWMQRTAQDWLGLERSHGRGSAPGNAAGRS